MPVIQRHVVIDLLLLSYVHAFGIEFSFMELLSYTLASHVWVCFSSMLRSAGAFLQGFPHDLSKDTTPSTFAMQYSTSESERVH